VRESAEKRPLNTIYPEHRSNFPIFFFDISASLNNAKFMLPDFLRAATMQYDPRLSSKPKLGFPVAGEIGFRDLHSVWCFECATLTVLPSYCRLRGICSSELDDIITYWDVHCLTQICRVYGTTIITGAQAVARGIDSVRPQPVAPPESRSRQPICRFIKAQAGKNLLFLLLPDL